ncbi:hypothetical protein D9M71_778570 [compost metagenome]
MHNDCHGHLRVSGELDLQGGGLVRRQLTPHAVRQTRRFLLLAAIALAIASALVVLTRVRNDIFRPHQPAMDHHFAGAVDVDDASSPGQIIGRINAGSTALQGFQPVAGLIDQGITLVRLVEILHLGSGLHFGH